MIQFTKSIQLIESEYFTPQIGVFTLLDGTTVDEEGTVYVRLQFELQQNHQSGNITRRTGVATLPKAMFDTLNVQYDGSIGTPAACVALLQNFNINDLTDQP